MRSKLNGGFFLCGAYHDHGDVARDIGLLPEKPVAQGVVFRHVLQMKEQCDVGFAGHGIGLRNRLLSPDDVQKTAHMLFAMKL